MRTEFVAPAASRAAFRLPTLSRLPPLTALRAFVVAARHASFSRAAEELHVSTAAIGQQVRILETHLGQPLFSRQRGELLLTDAGSALYPGLADAFETMIGSLSDLMVSNARPQLKVLAEGCFAARWLAPRLGSIVPALGDVELSIESIEGETVDLTHFDADCAIVATHAQIPGFLHEPLFADTVSAVCTPEFAARHELADGPEQLRDLGFAMLRGNGLDAAFEWANWLRACRIPLRLSATGPRFSRQTALIEAILSGHGIGLARHSLISEELKNGRLIAPFGSPQPTASRYHLLTSPDRRRLPEVASLLALLREDIRALEAAA
ncbi:LysR substrate-binding domain-containing protein [Rhizobium sp. UGM030330-04]|uniref:LysR substrate-binding domain-containing protein n=1 Tax=Rhizobium sp. UGM030330-04 TaxID=1378077 RepID=UPI000DA05206|nr:LysR substrate-binding domain-containing protein [Rhizobium sp. UGM030330-04]PYG59018.1 LysR family glycine cleavage system transcriptional activator [Rhizobium sp. UGM030330-04]